MSSPETIDMFGADGDTPEDATRDEGAQDGGIDVLPEGIHFDLDENIYHADKSIGSGSVRQLAKCPVYYWGDSWMNPLREQKDETPALLYGRALHCLVLEGTEKFQRQYRRSPTRDDAPDALDTVSEIKAMLAEIDKDVRKELGIKLTGSKEELTGYLRSYAPDTVFWADIVAQFQQECARDKATILNADTYLNIIKAAEYITAEESVRAAFQNGVPEISLFWTVDGVPIKARLDYTRLGKKGKSTVGIVTDLKSFANIMQLPPERAVGQAITKTRLDVQMAAYMDGIQQIPKWISEGKVYGAEAIEPAWLDALASVSEWQWYWCFYEKNMPISMLRSVRVGSDLHTIGTATYARALQAYRDNVAAFGYDWRFVDPIPDPVIDTQDLPAWHGRDE